MPYEPGRLVQPLQQECLFQQQQYGVVYAPQHEIPAGAVPQAGQQPDNGDVQELPPLALAVAAQGDVDVLPEPGGQADVPPPPELSDGTGLIGIVEVLQEVEPEEMPQADGHVRVAGEVKIDLERVRDGADPRRDRCGVRHGGDVLPDGAHLVGDEHLLAQTDHQPLQTLAGLAHRLPPVLQVVGHRLVLHDRPRDQLGEQRYIRAEVHDVPLGRYQPPVHVDGIAHGLEGVEGDTDGQQQPQRRDGCAQQTVQVADGKIRVLEKAQDRQVSHHRDDQHRLGAALPSLTPKVADGQTVAVVEHRGEQHDQNVLRLTPAVKQQAEDKQ